MTTPDQSSSDFVITHTFDAPRELVFQSWVEPERLAQSGTHAVKPMKGGPESRP